jgi:hypothetical protein
LVKPSEYAAWQTKEKFKNGEYGLVVRADWDTENRILYVEILVGAKTFIEREYRSISQFWNFWNEAKP